MIAGPCTVAAVSNRDVATARHQAKRNRMKDLKERWQSMSLAGRVTVAVVGGVLGACVAVWLGVFLVGAVVGIQM
jgi:hypothetical protein